MADQEDRGHQESSSHSGDPPEEYCMEVGTEDAPLMTSGGDLITPEEEEILMGEQPQSDDSSPRSETASVSGEMSGLHLSSPV